LTLRVPAAPGFFFALFALLELFFTAATFFFSNPGDAAICPALVSAQPTITIDRSRNVFLTDSALKTYSL
jgi:hypothetical protein